jgi:hypothetical protein
MEPSIGFGLRADASPQKGSTMGLKFKNTYTITCRRSAEDPTILWRETVENLTTNEGCNNALQNQFKASAYTAAWYVGLINNASFTALADTDSSAQINGSNGWVEDTAYSGSVRQTLTLGSVSSGSVSNTASPASFTMNATGTLNGAFVASTATQGAGAGGTILYGEASFGSTQPYVSGNVITVTITLTAVTA